MKRLFTLAIVAMIASLTFAQAPVQKKAAVKSQIEKVAGNAQMQKALEAKAAMAAKAQAAQETSGSVLRKAATRPVAAAMQMKAPRTLSAIAMQNVRPVMGMNVPARMQKSKLPVSKAADYTIAAESMFKTRTAPAKPHKVQGELVAGDYVIKNVENGKYLNGSNDWGTKVSVTEHGQFMTLELNDGKYAIKSHYSNGGGKDYIAAGDNTYLDAAVAYHEIEAVQGGYTIKDANGKYLVSDGIVANFNGDEPQVWEFISKAELLASSAPADFTALVPDADFSRNNTDFNKWEGAGKMTKGGPNNAKDATARGMNAERWGGNSTSIDFYTTLTDLPNGTYTVKFQGLYRYNNTTENTNAVAEATHADGTEKILSNFYANEVKVPFVSIADEASVALYGKMPFSQAEASEAFTKGAYQQEVDVEVTDGTLTLKVEKLEADHEGCDWTIIDNIELTFKEAPVEPTVIEATDAAATYYASDGDWYCVLKGADNNIFYFDIVTNNPDPLEIGHTYTLADMDASYSYMKVGSKNYAYSSATFTPKQGQYGTDYEATCVLASNGEAYHIYYTAPKPETLEVEATTAGVTWYGEPDNDWFINLYNANFEFRFDIPNQSAEGLLLDHEYTLADMLEDYSWGKNKATGASIIYQSVSFKATTGANGTDYAATVVDKNGNTYNVKYTTVAPPPTTETVELEFSAAETDLVDASASAGLIQFIGSKEDTGLEAYVGLVTTQVAGEYTFDDVEALYTSIYLDYNDYEGVQCADLTGTVTDLGNGAYKAVFDYTGSNGTLYKLTFNYGEAGEGPAGEVVVTKDANGIITNVTGGEEKMYTRQGTAYYVSGSSMYIGAQEGTATIIEDAANGKVYIKNPISRYAQNSWAEGTVEDGKIIVATKQPLAYNAQYAATISLRWGVVDAEGNIAAADAHADNFVYVIDGDKLILQGTESFENATGDAFFMGAFWDDDDSATGYGDAETVLTYDPNAVAPSTELVELPAGAEVNEWTMNATQVSSSSSTPILNQAANVAFVGNDVYVQGIFKDLPTSWVKGTKEGNTVNFAKGQYLGVYAGQYDIWFMGVDPNTGDLKDAAATLSEDGQTITFNDDILANAKYDEVYYLAWLENVVISATPAEEPVITEMTAALPYANSFETEDEVAEAAIYDANSDGKTWTIATDTKTGSQAARYTYHSSNTGDDYVVFPGFTMEAGKSYKVQVDARPYGASYPERIEIVAGTVAKASELNITVLEPTDVAASDYETLTAEFVPEADGVYYIALHAISDADMFYLYADNFSVAENDPLAPAAVTDLVAVADPEAALKATIKFTVPTTTVEGAEMSGYVQYVLNRDGEQVKVGTVAPGTPVEYVDETIPAPATVTYAVRIQNGEHVSDAASVKVYVGEDIPDDVENLAVTDLNGKVALTWDAPADGVNGGIILAENLKYNVYPVEMFEFFGMTFPDIDFENPYMTGLTATEATVDYDTNEGEQGYTYFGVTAENTAGESMGAMAATLTGAPYELPVVEEFTGGTLSYWWGVDYDDAIYEADGGLGLTNDGQIAFQAPVAGWIELYSGKIALAGADKPQMSFLYSGSGSMKATVYGPAKSKEVTLTPAEAAQTAVIDLAELASEPWVRLTLRGEFAEAGEAYFDNFIVMNAVENDLDIAVSAPATVVAGKSATVKATVTNKGTAEASAYAVQFSVNDEVVETISDVTSLKFFESAEYSFSVETSIFAEAGDLTVKAEVVYANDAVEANNADEAVVSIVASTATPVETVTAAETAEGVKIDWTVAANTPQEITEDFESYEGNTVYADGESMGDWLAVDLGQNYPYTWNGVDTWTYTEPFAFGVMNFVTTGLKDGSYSGEQAVVMISEYDASGNGVQSDKYMISPELPGIAQTVSFQLMVATAQYGAENIEVMASSTDTNVASFTKVASISSTDTDWTEYTANLPEGTKYFAIHYCSNDVFAVFIDDVKYTAGGSDATGFNVYVDEVQVASVAADARTYTATNVPAGDHKFSVTAVYGNNESAPVSATLATAINSVAATSAATEAYTISGIRMDAKNLKRGVYVINGKKVVK